MHTCLLLPQAMQGGGRWGCDCALLCLFPPFFFPSIFLFPLEAHSYIVLKRRQQSRRQASRHRESHSKQGQLEVVHECELNTPLQTCYIRICPLLSRTWWLPQQQPGGSSWLGLHNAFEFVASYRTQQAPDEHNHIADKFLHVKITRLHKLFTLIRYLSLLWLTLRPQEHTVHRTSLRAVRPTATTLDDY